MKYPLMIRCSNTMNANEDLWRIYSYINHFIVDNVMSEKQGDELLDLFKNLCIFSKIKNNNLPLTSKDITMTCKKDLELIYDLPKFCSDFGI